MQNNRWGIALYDEVYKNKKKTQMVIPKPAHLAMPTCEMPPTLHLYCKGTKKSVTSNKSSGFFLSYKKLQ